MKKLLIPFCLVVAASCQAPAPQATPDSGEANKALMQRFYDEVINAHDVAMLDSFCAPDIVDHESNPRHPDGVQGLDSLRASMSEWFSQMPDVHFTSPFMVAEGDTVTALFNMTATMTQPGAEPKQLNVNGVDIVILRDGKCVEHWGFMEEGKMYRQMGLMPAPGAAPDSAMAGETDGDMAGEG